MFSSSNCTGRGLGWRCCVPNYLRMFPKIATETSPHVRTLKCLVARALSQLSHIFSLSPSEGNFLCMCSLSTSASLSPSVDDATRVILKSTDDYINANYINVSLHHTFFFFFHLTCLLISLWVIGSLLGVLFHLLLRHKLNAQLPLVNTLTTSTSQSNNTELMKMYYSHYY